MRIMCKGAACALLVATMVAPAAYGQACEDDGRGTFSPPAFDPNGLTIGGSDACTVFSEGDTPEDNAGGHVSFAGATLFVDFFFFGAGTNDFIDVDQDGCWGFRQDNGRNCTFNDLLDTDQLATGYNEQDNYDTCLLFQYRSVGSVNGFNEFVNYQLCGVIEETVPSEAGIFDRFEYAEGGTIQWGGPFDNPSGTPHTPCAINGSFLDVPGKWATRVDGEPNWDANPGSPGYGLNPIPSNTGFVSNLLSLSRDCEGDVVSLNTNEEDPDENTIFNYALAWVPVVHIANKGTEVERMTYTQSQYHWTTGRFPNGMNMTASTRDVGSGTRNAFINSLGIDTSWGRGDNIGAKIGETALSSLGPNTQPTNCGGSSIMENSVRNRRLAIGYTGLAGGSRAARDASLGVYEVIDVCKDVDENGNPLVDCNDVNNYVRPTLASVLDNCDPAEGFQIGGNGSFVIRGNINGNRCPNAPDYPVGSGNRCIGGNDDGLPCLVDGDCDSNVCDTDPLCDETTVAVENQAVAEYMINLVDSIAFFSDEPQADENSRMPGQQLARAFFLPAGTDCGQSLNDGMVFTGSNPFNQGLQDFILANNDLGTGIPNFDTPAYNEYDGGGDCPDRLSLALFPGIAAYSDGSVDGDYAYWDGGNYERIASGVDLALRNKIAADFDGDGTRIGDHGDGVTEGDVLELVRAYRAPRSWQQLAIATGGAAGADLGGMEADNAIPEVMGDFNGDGNLDKEDLRYYADGLTIVGGMLDRKTGAIIVDTALATEGVALPWADDRASLVIPPVSCADGAGACDDPTFEVPGDINLLLATNVGGAMYAAGDFRGDVYGGAKADTCDTEAGTCNIGGGACANDEDCPDVPTVIPGGYPNGWDARIDNQDIDYVCRNIGNWNDLDSAVRIDLSCDMDGDVDVDADDVAELVEVILKTQFGDADLDNDVDGDDEATVVAGAADACNDDASCGWADGNFDCDGVVGPSDYAAVCDGLGFAGVGFDLTDHAAFTSCMGGANAVPASVGCCVFDFDGNGTVDLDDWTQIQNNIQ